MAFVVWGLASAGYTGPELQSGLRYVKQNLATEQRDAYSLGIIANAFAMVAPTRRKSAPESCETSVL